jgi:hypothetical protein
LPTKRLSENLNVIPRIVTAKEHHNYYSAKSKVTKIKISGVWKMPNPKKGLAAGVPALDFRLPAALGEGLVSLADFRDQWVVLLFFRGVG